LRVGDHGDDVLWLRKALAAYGNESADLNKSEFDVQLEQQLKDFQRAHGLSADGVAGRFTLVHLNTYLAKPAPPQLTAMGTMAAKG